MNDDRLQSLLEQSAAGDQAAFAKLYDAVAPQLLAIAKRILRDHHQAEDVLQQTMIAVWHNAGDFDASRSRAATWLTSITRYRALDVVRKQGRRQAALSEERHDIESLFGHDATPADPVSDKLARRLAYCFGEISRDQAACIQLAYLEGLTLVEIAERLQRSLGTVKSWVRRGLKKLQECVSR